MTFYRLAVLGDPIDHSRSPQIHHTLLEMSGLEGQYDRVRADRSVLAECVKGLRTGEWNGLNVTIPLKTIAAEMADELEITASRSGSVNTLVANEATVTGHSTDASTFSTLVSSDDLADRTTILILGAGGSALATMAAVAARTVYVAARRPERAAALADLLGGEPVKWGAAVAGALVINTTPLGMRGERLPDGILEAAEGLIDLPYRDTPTPAVLEAERRGIPVTDGFEFLIRQAVDSFHLWTGADIDVDEALSRLRNT